MTDNKNDYTHYAQMTVRDDRAVLPELKTDESVGFDLTAIAHHKQLTKRTSLYDTGIAVTPPKGYYFEIVPRSSISKTGYILANNTGIIDPDYTGNIYIALMKVDDSMPDLMVPFTKCQLILRKKYDFIFERVHELDATERGHGGFGSTDK